MKIMFFKRHLIFVATVFALFSCTTKEDKVKEYVDQNVVTQAEEYLICQAIIKYVQTDAKEVFTNSINYYVNHPDHDFTFEENYLVRNTIVFQGVLRNFKQKFDKRWSEYGKLYNMLSYEGNIKYLMHQIDSTLTFKDLTKETSSYSIEDIAAIYFQPNHMEFTEITPKLYDKIFRSMLCLGAKTYKYDVVDEIRVTEKDYNLWAVDLVYHSGDCMALEIGHNEEHGFFVSKAPWLPEVWGDEDNLWGDEEPQP